MRVTAIGAGVLVLVAGMGIGAAGLTGGSAAIGTASAVVAAGTVGAAQSAAAFRVDVVHSTVLYSILHFGAAYNYGRFDKLSGSFVLDAANPSASSLEITVDAGSVNSGNAQRDEHLRSDTFFATGEFPTITFKGKEFASTDGKNFTVTGDLTLLGKTKTITVTVQKTGEGQGQRGPVSGVRSVFTIKRSEFGMNGLQGPLGDDVELIVSLEGGR